MIRDQAHCGSCDRRPFSIVNRAARILAWLRPRDLLGARAQRNTTHEDSQQQVSHYAPGSERFHVCSVAAMGDYVAGGFRQLGRPNRTARNRRYSE